MDNNIVLPKHVALIPDGNRRWSKKNKLHIMQGYELGINKFIEFAKWSSEFGIKTISVWALSNENIKNRNKQELDVLFNLYLKAARDKKLINDLIKEKIRFNVIGDLKALPSALRLELHKIERLTRKYNDLTINMLINYSGKNDLVYAAKQISKKVKQGKIKSINDEIIRKNLMSAALSDVDLVIRTSGEIRLSGLLPWQTAYSEFYFENNYWPEFTKKDYKIAIDDYSRRQRRFGK
ncbi:MAG: polyprenyl diphosphate synthase [Candidatus Micrarchaeia archaeon]